MGFNSDMTADTGKLEKTMMHHNRWRGVCYICTVLRSKVGSRLMPASGKMPRRTNSSRYSAERGLVYSLPRSARTEAVITDRAKSCILLKTLRGDLFFSCGSPDAPNLFSFTVSVVDCSQSKSDVGGTAANNSAVSTFGRSMNEIIMNNFVSSQSDRHVQHYSDRR